MDGRIERSRRYCRQYAGTLLLAVAFVYGLDARPAAAQMERVVRIGVLDGPPEYTFGRVGGLAVVPDGRVLVLDALAHALRAYSPEGEHLFSFGSEGQGPGELRFPTSPVILDGGIVVYDQRLRRLVRYTFSGEHVETRSFATDVAAFSRLRPLRFGQWIGADAQLSVPERRVLVGNDIDLDDLGRRPLLFVHEIGVDTVLDLRRGDTRSCPVPAPAVDSDR